MSDASTIPTSSEVKLAPMSIGKIMDRALRLTPVVFGQLFFFYALYSAVTVAMSLPFITNNPGATIGVLVLGFIFGVMAYFALMYVSAAYWLGGTMTTSQAISKISGSIILRCLWLFIVTGFIAFLGFLLFIIPGVIYSINRCLAPYILIVEDTSVDEAIKKSKYLMTRGKWYSLSGPYMRVTAIFIVVFVISLTASGIQIGAAAVLAGSEFASKLSAIINFAAQLLQHFAGTVNCLCYVGLFYDLCARYEGSDLGADLDKLGSTEHGSN